MVRANGHKGKYDHTLSNNLKFHRLFDLLVVISGFRGSVVSHHLTQYTSIQFRSHFEYLNQVE